MRSRPMIRFYVLTGAGDGVTAIHVVMLTMRMLQEHFATRFRDLGVVFMETNAGGRMVREKMSSSAYILFLPPNLQSLK